MTTSQPPSTTPFFAAMRDTGRSRRAIEIFDRAAVPFSGAVRRAVPFFSRRGVVVTARPARAAEASAIEAEVEGPSLVIPLATEPGGARAFLALDAQTLAILLDGILGGSSEPQPIAPTGLSGPQRAVIVRVAEAIARELSNKLSDICGLRLVVLPGTQDRAVGDATMVAITLTLDHGTLTGQVTLAVAKDALVGGSAQVVAGPLEGGDPRVVATLGRADIDVVAELGRVSLPLGALSLLRVGDTLRLNVPVDGAIVVRAAGVPVFDAQPTTSGSLIALRVVGPHRV